MGAVCLLCGKRPSFGNHVSRLGSNALKRRVKARTRQFARRQETWFRSLSECRFVEMSDEHSPEQIAAMIQLLVSEGSVHERRPRSDAR